MSVSIPGRILDERYTQLLMEQTDLTLTQVILLDRVQKKQPLDREEHKLLKSAGLVEGRFPSIMVSGQLAKMTGETGRHIRERGFDKQYYLDLILALAIKRYEGQSTESRCSSTWDRACARACWSWTKRIPPPPRQRVNMPSIPS